MGMVPPLPPKPQWREHDRVSKCFILWWPSEKCEKCTDRIKCLTSGNGTSWGK